MNILIKIIITFSLFKIASTDWKVQKIYNKDLVRLLFCEMFYLRTCGNLQMTDKIIGILIISIPMLIIALLWPGSFGGGDIKLMAICGLLLGRNAILRASWIALVIAAAYSLWILLQKKSSRIEFSLGPFICMGVLVVFLDIF